MLIMETIQKQLEWYKRYSYYVSNVHFAVDGAASGFADGDEEYYESISCPHCSYDIVSDEGFLMGHYCYDNQWID